MVVDGRCFEWKDAAWRRPELRDLVIYELHIGTFSSGGTFGSAISKLQHLRDHGINAMEIMPIGDFAGARNWGYDGVMWYAPSRAYGHPNDLRRLVNAAHEFGIAVILDVVYNHFGPAGNYLPAFIGEYLDEAQKTPWGGAIRYADPAFAPLRKLATRNPGYWMHEFHIDGFRLDATHAIYDRSQPHILAELTEAIHAEGGLAIAEDPRNDVRLITPVKDGGFGFDAVWADDFHHVIRVGNTKEAEGYFADFRGDLEEAVQTLNRGWLYCGQPSATTGQPRGTPCGQFPPASFVHCIANHDQTGNHAYGERLSHRILPTARRAAEALLCLSPYTPMLFMGQEWAASTPFLFFTDHHEELAQKIVEGRREEFRGFAAFRDGAALEKIPNPQAWSTFEASKLLWEERERPRHAQALSLYRECLALRARERAFRPRGRSEWQVSRLGIGIGALRLEGDSGTWVVLFDLEGGHRGMLKGESVFEPGDGIVGWRCILSTNETRFGGTGRRSVDVETMMAEFEEPETVVLHRPFQTFE